MDEESSTESKSLVPVVQDDNFKKVVRRVYEIAQQYYDNDIKLHIQQIYNRLNDNEQKIFLDGVIPHLFERESPPKPIEIVVNGIDSELSLEQYNQIELIKLKSWLVKCCIVVVAFFIALGAIFLCFKLISPKTEKDGMFDEFGKFIETIIDS